jgi:hypothetical protein
MAQITQVNFPMTPPPEQTLSQGTFELGEITLIEQSNLPPNALAAAINLFLYEKGAPGPRWGTKWYGSTSPTLPAPTALTATKTTGTALGIGVYQYQVTFVNSMGETSGGTTASVTTTSGSQDVSLTAIPTGAGGVTARRIYRTKVGASTFYLVATISDNTTTTATDITPDASLTTAIPTANTTTAVIDGSEMYTSASGANHLLIAAGGNIFHSLNNGITWVMCTGATLTPGKKVYFTQASADGSGNNYLYISDGYDYPVRYNGTTTLTPYVAILPPTTPTVTKTGLTAGVYEYYYRISAVNAVGFTQASASGTITTNVSRESWDPTDTGNYYVTLSWAAVTGAVRYDIYLAEDAADDAANNNYYLDSVGAVASPGYVDNGQTATDPNSTAPLENTTGGPRCREFTLIDARMWGTEDRDFPYRAWWTGSGPFVGYFSDSYDGGYIDLQIGSQYYPVKVVDYRDGKGDPLTTIFCNSSDTVGCIWQVSLAATTLLDTQFTQPTANKLAGSRGTPAPNSVVGVDDDFMFFNYQAIYDLGSRQSLFNLLSSDEYSANIRTTLVNNINPASTAGIAAWFYLAKVFISVPYNSTSNNAVIIYDTERKAFLTQAYSYGFERMFQYTDTTGSNHLLFWKTGDTQLSETNANFLGDYGEAFPTSLLTGLIPTQKSRFDFMYVDTAYVELSQQIGDVIIELIGVDRTNGYILQKTATMSTLTNAATSVGWDTFAWDTDYYDDSSAAVQIYAESTSKRYFIVNKELNAYQYHLTTNSINSAYVLRTLQISGTATDAGMPHTWRLTAN